MTSSLYTCPGCAQPMQRRAYERKTVGELELDLCFTCQGIWFDQYESSQLTPGAVIKLFGHIHDHHGVPRQVLGEGLACPRCSGKLTLTHDVQRTNRISYYRCANEHGRFTTFAQFLREKNFVRSLSGAEVAQLKVSTKQVRCSSCAAPVDVERDAQCSYCRSPLSILDADAVKKALADLTQAERKRKQVDPSVAVDAVLAGKRIEPKPAGVRRAASAASNTAGDIGTFILSDLVFDAIGALFE